MVHSDRSELDLYDEAIGIKNFNSSRKLFKPKSLNLDPKFNSRKSIRLQSET